MLLQDVLPLSMFSLGESEDTEQHAIAHLAMVIHAKTLFPVQVYFKIILALVESKKKLIKCLKCHPVSVDNA